MNKPILSKDFTIDDIHKLREYNYQQTKNMSVKERSEYYIAKGCELYESLQAKKKKTDFVAVYKIKKC